MYGNDFKKVVFLKKLKKRENIYQPSVGRYQFKKLRGRVDVDFT